MKIDFGRIEAAGLYGKIHDGNASLLVDHIVVGCSESVVVSIFVVKTTEKMSQSMYTPSCKRHNTYEWQERLEACLSICREWMLEIWTCSISRRKKEK